jgi:hypothetical protein
LVIVGFWLVMMTALVRLEYSERVSALDEVPVDRVLRKVLAQPDPTHLNIYYLGRTAGVFRIESVPIYVRPADRLAVTEGRILAYRVNAELDLDFSLGEMPIRIRAGSDSVVTRRLDLERLNLRGTVNGAKFLLRAENTNGQMAVAYDIGEGRREVKFDPSMSIGLARSLGLPDGLVPTGPGASHTKAYFGRLNIGPHQQRAYVIETRLNEALWAKLWVDEGGQIIQAETSAGISARSDLLEAVPSATKRPQP